MSRGQGSPESITLAACTVVMGDRYGSSSGATCCATPSERCWCGSKEYPNLAGHKSCAPAHSNPAITGMAAAYDMAQTL